ncbi:FecR/PupR family sigma factor regulator, partial [Pseudomonas aeruginosa]|uniref:FecR/PupR family sigma factor regulator n=1 Tax=Pseudomonas aeruginosa TaxID=287 RepID=UPI0036E83C9A
MSEKPERQRIVEEAIEWMVRLQSGDFSAAEGDALERWKALSSEHAEVFRQLLGSLAPLQDSPWRGQPSATVLRALEQPSSRRRFVGGALGRDPASPGWWPRGWAASSFPASAR